PAIQDRSHNLYGSFFDNTYTLIDSSDHEIALNGGLRYDNHPNTGGTVSHRLSLMYSLMNFHYFRLTWGSSYRNPDFIESYYDRFSLYKKGDINTNSPDTYLHVYGQESNQAEKAMVYEFAYLIESPSRYRASAILFYSQINDFVYFITESDRLYWDSSLNGNVIPMPFKNIGDAHQYGAEAELYVPITDYLSGTINYTWYDQKEEEKIVKQLLLMTPQQMANAQLRFTFKKGWSANVSAHFRDATEWRTYTWEHPERSTHAGGKAPGYLIANSRIAYEFTTDGNQIEIALAVFNLFDKHYDAYPMDTSDIRRRITGYFSLAF
ncbi:MAG: TonB-dependent receptor, partial [Desulfobacterales bacterium]|nr:TonB-dependent receptor [Desulfobacterales bacterium]